MDGNLIQEIFSTDYANDLLDVIRTGSDIEEFLNKIENKQREDFIKNNPTILQTKKYLAECRQKVDELRAKNVADPAIDYYEGSIEKSNNVINRIINEYDATDKDYAVKRKNQR